METVWATLGFWRMKPYQYDQKATGPLVLWEHKPFSSSLWDQWPALLLKGLCIGDSHGDCPACCSTLFALHPDTHHPLRFHSPSPLLLRQSSSHARFNSPYLFLNTCISSNQFILHIYFNLFLYHPLPPHLSFLLSFIYIPLPSLPSSFSLSIVSLFSLKQILEEKSSYSEITRKSFC